MAKGLLLVFTGNGKGKSTAAFGLAFRALGHGFPVCVIQFLKGNRHTGELQAAKRFENLLDFHVLGRGFTWKSDDLEKDRRQAITAWNFAVKTIEDNRHRLIILDELTYLIQYGMLSEQEIIHTLAARPPEMHIVVTGRNATEKLVAAADLVTEMQAVKHPYDQGVAAQKGIEF